MGIRSTALGLGLCIALCAPAQAQETRQTIEGAQKFLELMLEGTTANLPVWEFKGGKPAPLTRRFGTFRKVATVRRCHSRAEVAFEPHDARLPHPDTNRTTDFSWDASTQTWEMRFDRWTSVEVHEKTNIHIHTNDHARAIVLKSSSEALVARLAHALNFLRKHCDAAAGTGF